MRSEVTRAAEGFDRRAFTVSEILRMQDAGILSEDENFELIEGEIVAMQAKGPIHETLKAACNIAIVRALPEHLWMAVEASVYLNKNTIVEPDLIVFPHAVKMENLKGSDILLAIEISASSLEYDLGIKSHLYAKYKIHEYWVVDVYGRTTYQHFGPSRGDWRRRAEVGPTEALTHALLPGFAIRLSDY